MDRHVHFEVAANLFAVAAKQERRVADSAVVSERVVAADEVHVVGRARRSEAIQHAIHTDRQHLLQIRFVHLLPVKRSQRVFGEHDYVAAGLSSFVDELFQFIEDSVEALNELEPSATRHAIGRAIALKASLVEQDERDTTGVRALLNYGHTVGHAIEASAGYGRYLHGEAIAIGMAAASRIARKLGLLPDEIVARQERVLRDLGLPHRCPEASPDDLRAAMGLDKKRQKGAVAWVLPQGLGQARSDVMVPDDLVTDTLAWVTETPRS